MEFDFTGFFSDFFSGLRSIGSWVLNIFRDSPLLYNPLIFTIISLSVIAFIIEELIGLLTSFRFGGWFIRGFRSFFVRPFSSFETLYNSEFTNNYDKGDRVKSFRSLRNPKYFVSYNGRLFPVFNKRYLSKYSAAGYRVFSASQVKSIGRSFSKSFSSSGSKGGSGLSSGFKSSSAAYNVKSGSFEKLGSQSLGLKSFGYSVGNSIADKVDSVSQDDMNIIDPDNIISDHGETPEETEERIFFEEYLAGLEAGEYD